MATILYPAGVINPELELHLEIDLNTLVVQWAVPERLNYLEGHFPGFPVLPGVAAIDVTLEAIRRVLGFPSVRMKKLQRAKFMSPIAPGQRVQIQLISLTEDRASWKAKWTVLSESTEVVSVAELSLDLDLGLSD